MDGFVHTAAGDASGFGLYDVLGHRAIGYFVGDNQLNYYHFMASSFATSDHWFSPVLSRTHPNRMYLYAATSAGHVYPLDDSNSPQLTNETIVHLLQDNGIKLENLCPSGREWLCYAILPLRGELPEPVHLWKVCPR